jgi:hypothetical protein
MARILPIFGSFLLNGCLTVETPETFAAVPADGYSGRLREGTDSRRGFDGGESEIVL